MVFRRIPYILCLSLLLVGCAPRGVMSPEEMENILYDLHRAEGILQVSGYTFGHDDLMNDTYQNILEKHGVTQAVFDTSIVWYTNNPKIFNKIYPRVIQRLEADLTEASKLSSSTQELEKIVSVETRQRVNQLIHVTIHGWEYDIPQSETYISRQRGHDVPPMLGEK